ncbi:collagen alpha-2(I) chain-like [Canis lupus familiaris]|uniref:collagen alpha-2(I) chain-like n=1 Tax=Canis lupus familiaris TaxID=9615 RepID=UPI0018F3DD3D|nr:collagen alpha-2(I) chain-like [Canis lupus familiaris]
MFADLIHRYFVFSVSPLTAIRSCTNGGEETKIRERCPCSCALRPGKGTIPLRKPINWHLRARLSVPPRTRGPERAGAGRAPTRLGGPRLGCRPAGGPRGAGCPAVPEGLGGGVPRGRGRGRSSAGAGARCRAAEEARTHGRHRPRGCSGAPGSPTPAGRLGLVTRPRPSRCPRSARLPPGAGASRAPTRTVPRSAPWPRRPPHLPGGARAPQQVAPGHAASSGAETEGRRLKPSASLVQTVSLRARPPALPHPRPACPSG